MITDFELGPSSSLRRIQDGISIPYILVHYSFVSWLLTYQLSLYTGKPTLDIRYMT